jgi:hypothetical protein
MNNSAEQSLRHDAPPSEQKEILWNQLKQQIKIKTDNTAHTDQAEKSLTKTNTNSVGKRASSLSSKQSSSSSCPYKREWPTYKAILDDITGSDYNHVLECPHDMVHKSRQKSSERFGKAFCPHGTACLAKLELFENNTNNKSYTGLLTPGSTIQDCVLRLSSAMKPPAKEQNKFGKFFLKATGGKLKNAKLFPMVALKCFRHNRRSGNLLFAGRKIGQASSEFFHHCLCTQMTERVPSLLKPFIKKFYSYSENPLSLGVSDFCAHDEHGDDTIDEENNFPYVVMLMPVYNTNTSQVDDDYEKFDEFIDDLLAIPSGSVLFDIYACPTPSCALDPNKIQRIGRIISTSEMIQSSPHDGLFFRHQKKEEDYMLRPQWREQVKATCSPDGGITTGSIDRLVGSTILETLISVKQFVDFGKNTVM